MGRPTKQRVDEQPGEGSVAGRGEGWRMRESWLAPAGLGIVVDDEAPILSDGKGAACVLAACVWGRPGGREASARASLR